jgi:hypothetical protein
MPQEPVGNNGVAQIVKLRGPTLLLSVSGLQDVCRCPSHPSTGSIQLAAL